MIAYRNPITAVKARPASWALLALAVLALSATLWRGGAQSDILRADPETVLGNPALRATALAKGQSVYEAHCASCHGDGGKGDKTLGAPDLTDLDHLHGTGTVAQIEDIARYGIRAGNKRGWNLAVMPAYASKIPDKAEPLPPQTPAQVEDLTQYLLSFSGRNTNRAAVDRGHDQYTKAGCWDCHGRDLAGDIAIGAPALTDNIWLYGGSPDAIRQSISRGRAGMSPAFGRVLSAAQLRNVAVYVASLAQTKQDRK